MPMISCYVNFALPITEYMKMILIIVTLIYYLITEKSKPVVALC